MTDKHDVTLPMLPPQGHSDLRLIAIIYENFLLLDFKLVTGLLVHLMDH